MERDFGEEMGELLEDVGGEGGFGPGAEDEDSKRLRRSGESSLGGTDGRMQRLSQGYVGMSAVFYKMVQTSRLTEK